MKDFISVYNVPVSLEERICHNKAQCILYVNDYSWVVDIDGYYEFYYTPHHFMGKISHSQMPHTVVERLKIGYLSIKGESIAYGQTKAHLKPSSFRLRDLEREIRVGTWYYAQGQNYVTFNNIFVCDDVYIENCERECSFRDLDSPIIHDMLRMSCRTKTPYYYKGVLDLPCFQGVDVNAITVFPFNGMQWDAEKWAKEFKSLSDHLKDYKSRSDADDIRAMRVEVFQHTVNTVKQGCYYTVSGQTVELPDDKEMIQNTTFYSTEFAVDDVKSQYTTEIRVQNIDCLLAAKSLQEDGYNVAVLNMASRQNPGGGVYGGAGAQEENFFRRSNLFRSMFQFAPYASQYGLQKSEHQYPLDRNFGGVYTPNAIVFRDIEKEGYKLLDSPFHMSFIAVPGINRPELDANGMIVESLIEPVKNKIRTIFRIGLIHGHDALVLGALGCGAFRNPPAHIARLFHEVIDEPEFSGKFKCLFFAILEDHNSNLEHNKEGNFKPFAEEFAGKDEMGAGGHGESKAE